VKNSIPSERKAVQAKSVDTFDEYFHRMLQIIRKNLCTAQCSLSPSDIFTITTKHPPAHSDTLCLVIKPKEIKIQNYSPEIQNCGATTDNCVASDFMTHQWF